jgi:geranylgeranyl diphosphate synthase type I
VTARSAPDPAPPALDARLATFAAAVDDRIRALLDEANAPAELDGMLRYHLGWADADFRPTPAAGGKRLRPAICLLACEAAGGRWETAIPSAAAVELVHNFSLVHDDIEDGSPLRRHRETLWVRWGVPRAINAGDALLVQAQQAVLRADWPAEALVAAGRLLNDACQSLCTGQHLDLELAEQPAPSLAAYYRMIEGKTAALLAAAAQLGALAAGAPATVIDAFGRFGREAGLAFQLQDDLLDAWGDAGQTGKPARADLRAAKCSLPLVLGLARASEPERARLTALCARPPLPDEAVDAAVEILDALRVSQAGDAMVREHYAAALAALDRAATEPEAAAQLRLLAEGLISRES